MGRSSLDIGTDDGNNTSNGHPMPSPISNPCSSSDIISISTGNTMHPKNTEISIASLKPTYNSSFSAEETTSSSFFPNKNHSIRIDVPLPLHMIL